MYGVKEGGDEKGCIMYVDGRQPDRKEQDGRRRSEKSAVEKGSQSA